LLHDMVEDSDFSLDQIQEEFGERVAQTVDGLTKLDKIAIKSREAEQAENVRKMMVAMARDIRVLLIKLADRLHNMRTLDALSADRQTRIATETLEIYAPLANRLGVDRIKWELEDLSFATMYPKRHQEIAALVEQRDGERQEYLEVVSEQVNARLRDAKITADVSDRPKHVHVAAEYGVAAHWRYKEGARKKGEEPEPAWLSAMLEWQKEMSDPREFMEGLRIDLYEGRVFVFTPKGDVVDLPAEATPI